MTLKKTPCLLPVFVLLLSITGCNLKEPEAVNIIPTEEIMKTIVRSEVGGYEFEPLKEYDITESEGTVTLFPPQSDPYSGPGMVMFISAFDQPVDLDHVISLTMKMYSQYSFDEAEMMQVSGFEAALLEYTTEYHAVDGVIQDYYGAEEGETIRGRILLVLRSPQDLYQCEMLAPNKQWKKLAPAFEEVIESLRFFEPEL